MKAYVVVFCEYDYDSCCEDVKVNCSKAFSSRKDAEDRVKEEVRLFLELRDLEKERAVFDEDGNATVYDEEALIFGLKATIVETEFEDEQA